MATVTEFDPYALRRQFPALSQSFYQQPALFFDSPGGTQVPQAVIDAVSRYYREQNANGGGAFVTSQRTDEVGMNARKAMAALLNAPAPEQILFGANMTTLTFHLARSLGETLQRGDEIIVTNLDHDANVTPWTDLERHGVVMKVVDIHSDEGTLDFHSLEAALSTRTKLVAFTYASNAVGTVTDVAAITRLAHERGAQVFIDAVQYAPHGPIDVQALDCDFLACSAYKFFGPHVGVLYGKKEPLLRLTPHKLRPAKDELPYRWETGTSNYEGLAGVSAAVEYLATVGDRFGGAWSTHYAERGFTGDGLRLKKAMQAIREYEKKLSERLISGLQSLEDVKIYGITDLARLEERVPTVAFTWPRLAPRATAEYLASRGICVWSGNYYALRLMERLGLEESGGAVRIGCVHYDTGEEIDRLIQTLAKVPRQGA